MYGYLSENAGDGAELLYGLYANCFGVTVKEGYRLDDEYCKKRRGRACDLAIGLSKEQATVLEALILSHFSMPISLRYITESPALVFSRVGLVNEKRPAVPKEFLSEGLLTITAKIALYWLFAESKSLLGPVKSDLTAGRLEGVKSIQQVGVFPLVGIFKYDLAF